MTLRVQLVYGEPGHRTMPIVETRDPALARAVFQQVEREFCEGAAATDDPVLRTLLEAELEQARRVLAAAGLLEGGD